MKSPWPIILLLFPLGCGSSNGTATGQDAAPKEDQDHDGVSPDEGDCNDTNAAIYPGAPEPCNGKDDNCNGTIDEGFDQDGDHITVCQGDCADNDKNTRPGALEALDGIDNDCDGIADNHNNSYDDDGDGYSEDAGDCDDLQPYVNSDAVEVQLDKEGQPEGVDNDCDGTIDEAPENCLEDATRDSSAQSYADAIELCTRVSRATFEAPTQPRAHQIMTSFGSYTPRGGKDMIGLATGVCADAGDPGFVFPDPGTDFGFDNVHLHPAPGGATACSPGDPDQVNDYSELKMELKVPSNAQSLSFDFVFMSAEYPEYVCQEFNDTFLAVLDSGAFKGNVSFDSMGNRVSINAAFFTVCKSGSEPSGSGAVCEGDAELAGTGYEGDAGGGTGWLTTTAPVIPGEKATLRFIIFDEGDHILDSAVLIDNFRWHLAPIDKPSTEG